MMEYIFYSIVILLLYVYCGIGLTLLLSPKTLEKYSLYLSPFVGLSYLSYIAKFFADYSTFGTDVYARGLLFPPFIFLIVAIFVKKERLGELSWPFRKENVLLVIICVIIFIAISAPFLFKLNGLTAMSLRNHDIAHYAAVSKFLTQSSFVQSQIFGDSFFVYRAQWAAHFSAYFSTAIPSSLFSIEPYKIQNLVINIFYVFSLPLIFLIGIEIFRYNKYMAMVITLLSGISYHWIYINYNGFIGQVIGVGMFLSVFLLTLYPILNGDKFSRFISYIPLATVLLFGLVISYSPLLPLFFIPLLIFILLVFISTKSVSQLLKTLSFLSVTIFATFLISPFTFIQIIKDILIYISTFGWNMGVLTPDWVFGIAGNNNGWPPEALPPESIIGGLSYNWPMQIIVSIPIVFVVIVSLIHLFRTERRLFYLSISYISFIFVLYSYLLIKEVSSLGFSGESYKAYKLITYFIPIILLAGLSYFRNFQILSIKKITKTQIFGAMFLILLIAGNIWSASAIIKINYEQGLTINEDIIGLQKITKMDNISSINIVEPPWWDLMWIYSFLFMDEKLYLKYSSYYPASPLVGEWTLQKNSINDVIELEPTIKINNGYILTKYNLEATLGNGWYGLESNKNGNWRWTGNNNDTITIKLYAQKDFKFVDFLLNYGQLDANNKFSVFLDNKIIKECEDKDSCIFNDVYISKGEHEIAFKTKLPPRLSGFGDPRTLGYAFSKIRIVVRNGD